MPVPGFRKPLLIGTNPSYSPGLQACSRVPESGTDGTGGGSDGTRGGDAMARAGAGAAALDGRM